MKNLKGGVLVESAVRIAMEMAGTTREARIAMHSSPAIRVLFCRAIGIIDKIGQGQSRKSNNDFFGCLQYSLVRWPYCSAVSPPAVFEKLLDVVFRLFRGLLRYIIRDRVEIADLKDCQKYRTLSISQPK